MDLCLAHLIFLRELQIVVGLEELCVLCQLGDGDGWVIHHTCSSKRNTQERPTQGREKEESPLAKWKRNSKTATTGGFAAHITTEHELSDLEAGEEHCEFHTTKKKNQQ